MFFYITFNKSPVKNSRYLYTSKTNVHLSIARYRKLIQEVFFACSFKHEDAAGKKKTFAFNGFSIARSKVLLGDTESPCSSQLHFR